jgi:hypothetical protein
MGIDALADAALAGVFDCLAVTIGYEPRAGDSVTVRAVPRVPNLVLAGLGGGQQLHDGLLVEVRVADLPAGAPAAGDVIDSEGGRFRVRSWRHVDGLRQVWLLDAVPA